MAGDSLSLANEIAPVKQQYPKATEAKKFFIILTLLSLVKFSRDEHKCAHVKSITVSTGSVKHIECCE